MTGILVRPERVSDRPKVREVNDLAFGGTLEGGIVDALRSCGEMISLVATVDDRVVGHIAFSPVTAEPSAGERKMAGLAPMAVHPEFQRQGIGTALVQAGIEECRRRGFEAVVVVGHPEYYPRFGFVPAHTFGLTFSDAVPAEAFMALELTPGAFAGVRGAVRYRPEFSEADSQPPPSV